MLTNILYNKTRKNCYELERKKETQHIPFFFICREHKLVNHGWWK